MGGRLPCGFHCTMDNPDLVRRVAPPTAIMPPTSAAVPKIQYAIGRLAVTFSIVAVEDANFCTPIAYTSNNKPHHSVQHSDLH